MWPIYWPRSEYLRYFEGFLGSICLITEAARVRSALLPELNLVPAALSTFEDVLGGGFSVRFPPPLDLVTILPTSLA